VHLSIILDNDQLDAHLLYFTIHLFTILYMFRALYAHHQEDELYLCSIWYRPLSQWSSGAQVGRELLRSSLPTCAPDDH